MLNFFNTQTNDLKIFQSYRKCLTILIKILRKCSKFQIVEAIIKYSIFVYFIKEFRSLTHFSKISDNHATLEQLLHTFIM